MSKVKIVYLIFLILAIIFSLVGWVILKGALFNGSATEGVIIVSSIFLMLGVALGLIFILFDNLWLLVLAPTASVALSFIFFGLHPVYLVIFVVGTGLVVFAASQSLKEKKAHIKVSLTEIVKPALGAIFTFLALTISAVIYFSPPAQGISVNIKVPRSLFNFVLSSMASVAPNGLVSFDQILNKDMEDKLYQAINNQINFFLQPYKRYLPYGLAIAVFLSLKAVSFIFVWIAIGLINLVFSGMKKIGWVNIKKEMVEKETLEF